MRNVSKRIRDASVYGPFRQQTIQTIAWQSKVGQLLVSQSITTKNQTIWQFWTKFCFFPFLEEISQQPFPYRHYINLQLVFNDVVLFVIFVWFYLLSINKNEWFYLLPINKLWFCVGHGMDILVIKQESEYARYVRHIPIPLVGSWEYRRYCDRLLIHCMLGMSIV